MKTYRTLLRVENVGNKYYHLVIPGIGYDKRFQIPKSTVPFTLIAGQRFHAKANLNAETEDELMLSDFEEK